MHVQIQCDFAGIPFFLLVQATLIVECKLEKSTLFHIDTHHVCTLGKLDRAEGTESDLKCYLPFQSDLPRR